MQLFIIHIFYERGFVMKRHHVKKIVLEKWQPVLLKTWSDKQKGTEDIAGGKVV